MAAAARVGESAALQGSRPAAAAPKPAAANDESRSLSPTEREALYLELQPLVRRLIRQYGADPEQRQDLEGELFCRFCQLLEQFDPARGVPLKAYLVRTLPAAVYTYARARWRNERRQCSFDQEPETFEAVRAADPTTEWIERLEMQAFLRLLPAAIARLPLRQRQVVIGRFYEGRSFEELAERFGVQPASIRSSLRYGIQNLRSQLQGRSEAIPETVRPAPDD